MRRAVLAVLCAPVDALGLLVVSALAAACWASFSGFGSWSLSRGCIVWTPSERSFVARAWKYSTTFGHVVLIHPSHVPSTSEVEHADFMDAPSRWVRASGSYRRIRVIEGGKASIILGGGGRDVMLHELVHVRQSEVASVVFAAATAASMSLRVAMLWPFAWLLVYASSAACAWLHGADPYHGNTLEDHASR